jgi:8-oxo-dGTP diphosphatase
VVGDVRESALDLEYTLCFCRRGDLVLMLYRNAPPFRNRWNGLGGRIEPGEGPLASVSREVMEEAGVDLGEASSVRFAGTVRWASRAARPSFPDGGMYVFVAGFPDEWPIWGGERDGPEGRLCWKPVGWVCDPDNRDVVSNLPCFLPEMLRADGVPLDWRGEYVGWDLVSATSRPLVGRVSL